ncbi:cell division ATP-binding protein FtsE [Paenibacillus sp. Pae15]|uniref:cell division ATP-binding protein FtsE n=1 Tax=Paenibacillus sp. Pae15 TaxID=2926018 RepID=UPI0006D260D3|nr:ABC transporter ATP-binding protein [Paenibacillus sp. Pae15]
MIHIRNVTKRYGERTVLDGVNLHLHAGEFAFLRGRSGSGKSTLLKLLYREIDDFTGDIAIDGQPVGSMPKYELRRKIGVIFQSFELLERKTVLENVELAGEVLGRSEKDTRAQALHLLKRTGLSGKERLFPAQLSGGEQQRVAIARALLVRPAIVLADEPTGNLDKETAAEMFHLLRELQREYGMTMLVVTHADRFVEAVPARTLHMEQGKIYEIGNG